MYNKYSLPVSSPRWTPLWLNCCTKVAMDVPLGVCPHFYYYFYYYLSFACAAVFLQLRNKMMQQL